MGPIVLIAGLLVALYGLASLFAGGGVASASRGVSHSRRYSMTSVVIGVIVALTGLVMIVS